MFQNSMFNQGAMPTLTRAISFTESRQRVIANNIANAETPGFQAKDLNEMEFNLRLKEAIYNRRYGNPRYYEFRDDDHMNDDTGSMTVRPFDNHAGIMKHSKNNVKVSGNYLFLCFSYCVYTSSNKV
jgi:flagellar basal-body rod protein FlgB